MKKSPLLFLLAGACLLAGLMAGCGQTQATVTPAEQEQFGKYGQPMPDAAKKYMQDHAAQSQPHPAAAPAKSN